MLWLNNLRISLLKLSIFSITQILYYGDIDIVGDYASVAFFSLLS